MSIGLHPVMCRFLFESPKALHVSFVSIQVQSVILDEIEAQALLRWLCRFQQFFLRRNDLFKEGVFASYSQVLQKGGAFVFWKSAGN